MARDRSTDRLEPNTLDMTDLQKSREQIDKWARQQAGGIAGSPSGRVSSTEPNSARFPRDEADLVVVESATEEDLLMDPLRAAAKKYIEPIPFAEFNYQENECMISEGFQMLSFNEELPEVVPRWVIFTQTCMRIYENEEMEMAKPNEPLV